MNQECNYKYHCIIGTPSEVSEYYDGDYLNFEDYKKIIDEGSGTIVLLLNLREIMSLFNKKSS